MADALDSKSSDRKVVWVQVPPPVYVSRSGRCAHLSSAVRDTAGSLKQVRSRFGVAASTA